jgi:hypothetical protein
MYYKILPSLSWPLVSLDRTISLDPTVFSMASGVNRSYRTSSGHLYTRSCSTCAAYLHNEILQHLCRSYSTCNDWLFNRSYSTCPGHLYSLIGQNLCWPLVTTSYHNCAGHSNYILKYLHWPLKSLDPIRYWDNH